MTTTVVPNEARALALRRIRSWSVGRPVVLASKIIEAPGEQVITFDRDGTLHLWADANAFDTPEALRRYEHPDYRLSQRFTMVTSTALTAGV